MERTDFEQWKAKEVARLLALVETERRYYQEIVASLPVALVVLASDRSVVSANRSFRHAFGLRVEDLRRKTIEQIIPSQALVERIRDVQMHAEAQPSFTLDLDDRRVRINVVPLRNWDDESDVETLLLVEEVSGEAAAPRLVPSPPAPPAVEVPAVLWKADPGTFAFTSVSGAAEEILGFPASHWLSTPQFFRERIHPEDRAATMSFYEAAVMARGDASAEFRAINASGEPVWCRETIRVTDHTISGVLTEIGLRRQLEQQMVAAERNEALHAAASRLAHDLNNPLMIITGYAEEMMQTLGSDDAMRADVQQILSATERISGITGQLLSFTRRLAAPARPVNISALIGALEEKIPAGERATVHIERSGGPVWGLADARQLEESILALASPARGGAKERSQLTLSCSLDAIAEQVPGAPLKPGVYARITIRDDGRGTEAPRAIFESALSGKDPGVSRAYSMVHEWGGDIAFLSEPFHGSVFTIYLPAAQPEVKPAEPEAPPTAAEPEPQLPTILLVEDEAGIRALVRKILRREHFDVLEAGTAEEALNVAARHEGRIDLLLTDVILPGMGGRELAEGMRESLGDLKVLYVSGFTDDEAVRAGTFPPGSKFLQKPFTLSALLGKVREALAD